MAAISPKLFLCWSLIVSPSRCQDECIFFQSYQEDDMFPFASYSGLVSGAF